MLAFDHITGHLIGHVLPGFWSFSCCLHDGDGILDKVNELHWFEVEVHGAAGMVGDVCVMVQDACEQRAGRVDLCGGCRQWVAFVELKCLACMCS